MKFFNAHIPSKIILNILLGLVIWGMIFILVSVNRMNSILNTDLAFNKDSITILKTKESAFVLTDSLTFSSDLPGFNSKSTLKVQSEYNSKKSNIEHQFISDNYFDFFNYKKINEKKSLFTKHRNAQLIYINESAAQKLGIYNMDDAPGTIITDENNKQLIICGVVKDFTSLTLNPKNRARMYQLTSEHLTYAFSDINFEQLQKENSSQKLYQSEILSFQQQIQNHYKIWEDIVYSMFLLINVLILLICLGHVGSKYAYKTEREMVKIFSIGIHVTSLVISKTYIYLIGIMLLVVVPIVFLIQKLWLEEYANRVHFGLIDLFIILSMVLLTLYLICCPKGKLEDQLRGKSFLHNSI